MMMRKFYVFAWLMLAGSVVLSLANGSINGLQMVAFSVIGLALVYAFALWAVLANAGGAQTE
jgi:hypothetical protein